MKPDRRWINTPEGQLATLVQIKHRDTGNVIFQRDVEGNTLAKTLRVAIILKIDVRHADLSGHDFSYYNFEGGNFAYCDFTGSKLNGANFSHARLDNASMSDIEAVDANFGGSTFHKTYAANSNFTRSNLSGALTMEGNFSGSNFSGCDLRSFASRGANFKGIIIDDSTILDETDTRISYRAPRVKVPNVCDGEVCQQCSGCESPKKLVVA